MTTDPIEIEKKTRRFTLVDGVVLALAVCALAAPFAARLQVQAHAAAPQVAVRSEVAAIRPIDIDLGYHEQKAEAAFYEGLGTENSEADLAAPIELAIVAPERVPTFTDNNSLDHPLHSTEQAAPIIVAEPERPVAIAPELQQEIAVLFSPLILDNAIEADTSDEPPKRGVQTVDVTEEKAPLIRVIMTAPPTMTPFPIKRPFHPVNTPITMVPLAGPEIQLPIDVTPPLATEIEEAPLPPLEVVALQEPDGPAEVVPASDIDTALLEPLEVRNPAAVEPVADAAPQIRETEQQPTLIYIPEPTIEATPPVPALPQEEPKRVDVAAKLPEPARPATRITNGPRIALVIAAAGLNESATQFAIDALPEGVTLAFAPVKAGVGELAREAKQDGHTVLVEIPLEPVNKSRDPGPLTLRVADTPRQNLDRLEQALARVPAADGASSYLGARFNADTRAVGPVVKALASRNLMLFENEPTSRSVFQSLAAREKLPYARGVVKFDRVRSASAIRSELDALEKQARARGTAVGVGTAFRSTISTVALWVKQAEKRGVRLVPIIEIAR